MLWCGQSGDWLDTGQPKPPKKRESARASASASPMGSASNGGGAACMHAACDALRAWHDTHLGTAHARIMLLVQN